MPSLICRLLLVGGNQQDYIHSPDAAGLVWAALCGIGPWRPNGSEGMRAAAKDWLRG